MKAIVFTRHATAEEYDNGETEGGSELETTQVHMETVRKIYTDLKAYHENF